MDTVVYESLAKVTPMSQPTASVMELKAVVECLAHALDVIATRLSALEARAPEELR